MKLPDGYVAGQGVLRPTGYGGFGERMLKQMGWDKGQGLGKEGQGMKEAIEVKKKEDTVGVGGQNRWKWDEKWWEQAFDSAAQTVNHSSDSDDSDSDDDIDAGRIAAAVGGATASLNRDGTVTTASMEELQLLAELSRGGRLAAGRFGGRDAKMERIRAQEAKMAAEAAAKLGLPSVSVAATTATGAATAGGSDRSETTSEAALTEPEPSKKRSRSKNKDSDEKSSKKSKKQKKEKKEKKKKSKSEDDAEDAPAEPSEPAPKRKLIVIEPKGTGEAPTWDFKPTPAEGWWGAAMFISAGCLDGMRKDIKASERAEFTEAQQESLYHAAHAGKTQGKVGLGQRSGPVKVGGVKWTGKKVSFEEEGAAEGAAEEDGGDAAARRAALHAVGSSTGLAALVEEENAAGEAPAWVEGVKWKKIVTKSLETAQGGEMKLKSLRSAVAEAVTAKLGDSVKVDKATVAAQVEAVLESSSRFVVDGKRVRLSAKK